MDQLICATFSHTNYWYEVGMLKVPALCGRATRSCWGGNIGTRIASTTSIQLLKQIQILSVENGQANPGRLAESVSGGQLLGRKRGQGRICFSYLNIADMSRTDRQPYCTPVDLYTVLHTSSLLQVVVHVSTVLVPFFVGVGK